MDPRALDAMMEYQLERYGNPHSRTHAYGWESEAVVEKAREQVANLIGASPKEVSAGPRGAHELLLLWWLLECWCCRCWCHFSRAAMTCHVRWCSCCWSC